jgi:hypothetical protein
MGLISGLLLLPLAPVRGVAWVGEVLLEEAERELYDEGVIRRQLAAIELEHDEGRMGDDEFTAAEDELLDRLEESRRREG